MDRKGSQTPQGETALVLVEFLEVAITSILFLKAVYPNGAFERRRYMNVVVHKARHPQLEEYIHSAVNGLLPFFEKGLVERVAVIFFNKDDVPIERFVFKLHVNLLYGSKVEQADLEFALRSFLIKLPTSESLTKVLPHGKCEYFCALSINLQSLLLSQTYKLYFCFFWVVILQIVVNTRTILNCDSYGLYFDRLIDCRWEIASYFRSLPEESTSKDAEMWIPTDTKQWQQPPLITPIKSMSSEPLGLQLFLEQPSPTEPKN